MKITKIGSDYISVDEDNVNDRKLIEIPRVHIIKLDFFKPTKEKILRVIENFPKTNRFVIKDNIRIYNYILRSTNKKYYIENSSGAKIISFFRKNNKVLVNFHNLDVFEKQFLLSDNCFDDVLTNAEVIVINQEIYEEKLPILEKWSGNVVISSGGMYE
jgi:hypothetical protein